MYSKILIPLDGSLLAEQVYPHVIEIARKFSSEINLVSVCEPGETESVTACELYINKEANQLRHILEDQSLQVKATILEGNPGEKILEYAKQNLNDIIMLSSHGRSGIQPWSLGTTVDKILHITSIPLIVIRIQENSVLTHTSIFKRIMVPLDGSTAGASIIGYILELVQKIPAEVILIQVIEKGHHLHTIGGLSYIQYKDQDLGLKRNTTQAYLENTAALFRETQAHVTTIIKYGDPAEEIIKYATETDTTLIALTSHIHSVMETWFYGSVTHKIIQAGKHSFFFVPSQIKRD
jgi:nucleotide-binding universal stress UspA family protein